MVQEYLASGGARSNVPSFLAERAIEHGSTDNITVIVVFLDCHRPSVSDVAPENSTDNTDQGTGDEK